MGKLPTIGQRFTGAIQANDQAQRIAELQFEIEQLRTAQSPDLEEQLEVLREQLIAQSGELEVDVTLINPNPHQPRQTITLESIQTIARSLERDGQISPLIIVQQGSEYLLWDGQRRWEAAKKLGWKTLRAVTAPMPENLHRKALLTFIHHEDLNPLDKAEAIVKEVSNLTGLGFDEISTILSTVLRRLERQQQVHQLTSLATAHSEVQLQGVKALGISEVEEKILLSFLDLALNPTSMKANLIPMLSLPSDLKESIRERGLRGAHALALAVLSAKTLKISESQAAKERMGATQRVIDEALTVAKTRALIAQIKSKYLKSETSDSREITAVARSVERLGQSVLSTTGTEQLVELRTLLQQKLAEIEAVLGL
jgi:ParB family transcriptional regulator, chromosome partitioning protein